MRTHAPQPLGPEVGKLGLGMLGGFTPQPDDNMPEWAACIVLLGPKGAAWDQISAAPEFHDGAPDPLVIVRGRGVRFGHARSSFVAAAAGRPSRLKPVGRVCYG